MACPYCTEPDIAERTIIRNDLVFAFPTNIPIVPGHVLVCPVRCVPRFEDLTAEERTAIFDMATLLRASLTKVFSAEGFHCVWNAGKVAGQSVPHFHLHVIPRREGDAGITEYEPRKFIYRPGSREVSPGEELTAVAELLRKDLAKE